MLPKGKSAFRREILGRRKSLPAWRLAESSRLIAQNVINSEEYKKSDTLLCFVPTGIEVDTRPVIERALSEGRRVAVPRCISGKTEMRFYYISGYGDLERGAFGIMEPVSRCPECTDFSGALCVTPALCCGRNGARMGYGRGYYDRFFAGFGGISCAVIPEEFLFDTIPCEPTDIPADMIVTENELIRLAAN
jgi:5-formyltetrahydrofolate cyclo-ligase